MDIFITATGLLLTLADLVEDVLGHPVVTLLVALAYAVAGLYALH